LIHKWTKIFPVIPDPLSSRRVPKVTPLKNPMDEWVEFNAPPTQYKIATALHLNPVDRVQTGITWRNPSKARKKKFRWSQSAGAAAWRSVASREWSWKGQTVRGHESTTIKHCMGFDHRKTHFAERSNLTWRLNCTLLHSSHYYYFTTVSVVCWSLSSLADRPTSELDID